MTNLDRFRRDRDGKPSLPRVAVEQANKLTEAKEAYAFLRDFSLASCLHVVKAYRYRVVLRSQAKEGIPVGLLCPAIRRNRPQHLYELPSVDRKFHSVEGSG